jgi:hypothetical protein
MKKSLVIALLLVVIAVGGLLWVMLPQGDKPAQELRPYFAIQDFGRAGDNAYLVYTGEGTGVIKIIGLASPPQQRVIVYGAEGIGNSRLPELEKHLEALTDYNISVTILNASDIAGKTTAQKTFFGKDQTQANSPILQGGILIVPTGAMPEWVLTQLDNDKTTVVIYFGETDLIIRSTTKKEDWYSALPQEEKDRILVKTGTLDDYLANGNVKMLLDEIAENRWAIRSYVIINATKTEEIRTAIIDINGSKYFRIIPAIKDLQGAFDYPVPPRVVSVNADKTVYSWEDSWVEVVLPKTNGTAYLNVEKDGLLVNSIKLGRVTEETAFRENLRYEKPGDYILKVVDNKGLVAIGILHVINVKVTPVDVRDTSLTFSVMIDGDPLRNGDTNVSIKDSASGMKLNYPIVDGTVTIQAKPITGKRTFVFELFGGKVESVVETKEETLADIYLKYGPLGLILIVIVFIMASLGKQQTYKIRIVEVAPEIRKEVRITLEMAEDLFKAARRDLKINGPLKPQEFAVGLKRYVTEGADVTEGNVEEILKKMGERGLVLNWNGYYQLATDGKIKKNVIMRMVSEKLIEKGIHYKISGNKFITKDLEIGFFGDRFGKKALVVFEDAAELKKTLAGMSEKERSKLFLKEFNGVLNLVPVEKLDESL